MTFDHGAWAGGPGAVEGFHPGRLDGVVTFLGSPPYTVFDAWFHWTD
ncbi:hypothetical protein [Nonomuraea sp. NPDC049504]